MTVKELRILVDNLDEYIRIPGGIERLRKTILHLAVTGKIVPQDISEGTGKEHYEKVQKVKRELVSKGKNLPEVTKEEILDEIPASWKLARLGEVCSFEYGKGLEKNDRDDDGAYFAYGANGALSKTNKFLIESNAIIVGRKGSAGAVNLYDGPMWPTDVTYYVPEGQYDAFDINYLFYLLISLELTKLANGIKPGLNRNDAYEKIVGIPPLKEQKRIVSKLSETMGLIDSLQQKYEKEVKVGHLFTSSSLAKLVTDNDKLALENLLEIIKTKEDIKLLEKMVLSLAIRGRLVSQDPSEGSGEELYHQINDKKAELITEGKIKRQKEIREYDTNLFEIPDTWCWVHLGDLYQIRGGKRLPAGEKLTRTETPYVYIRVTDMKNGTVELNNLHYLSEQGQRQISQYIITSNDLYLSIAGSIGKVGTIPEILNGANLTENAARLSPYLPISNDFYKAIIESDFVQNQFLDKQIKMAQPKLALFRIANSMVPLPSIIEQNRIIEKVQEIFELTAQLRRLLTY